MKPGDLFDGNGLVVATDGKTWAKVLKDNGLLDYVYGSPKGPPGWRRRNQFDDLFDNAPWVGGEPSRPLLSPSFKVWERG
jgi:hypothetical protein